MTRQGFDFFHGAFRVRYPFGKYDQLFVPEYKAGAMENAGAVTFLEDYLFRSRVTDFARQVRADDDPARDGAHVVRRPGHHALVGRPVAERVVRHLGSPPSPRRRPPAGAAPGPRSRSWRRPGPTARTSCPPPTRSRRTCPTSRRWRSTSTASPTPRARPCSSSSSPTSGWTTSWPGCAATSASTPGPTPRWGTCWRQLDAASGRELAGWSKQWLETAGVNTLRPEFDRPGRHVHRVRGPAGGPAGPSGAPRSPHRDRALRSDRRLAWSAGAGWRPTSPVNGPWWPSWPASAGPTWC